jgi:predicted 2-oxoglutarate/Fe(II)-dependent dioxygenase YbiX
MSAGLPLTPLSRGELAPWFRARALSGSDSYAFETAAGRHILMLFCGTAARPESAEALRLALGRRDLFDDDKACFFGVTVDPADVAETRIRQSLPGVRWFLDYDWAVSRLFRAAANDGTGVFCPHWLLLDPTLRVIDMFPLQAGAAALAALQEAIAEPLSPDLAPVLTVPRVFEPELCRELIARYEADGGEESGFMRQVDGKTVLVKDPAHKRRRDCPIEDPQLQRALQGAVGQRLVPMIRRAFQFEATRMERYIVACYDAAEGGHFRAHRDNTTKGTAHRRFAVTINLNAGDYEGGDLGFPEYGKRTYRAPTGGAVVFSCSLLHEATPVTRGRRYAFLPFLYDEAAATLREANNRFLDDGIGAYRKD